MTAAWLDLAYPKHLAPDVKARVSAELWEYGKRMREVKDLDAKVRKLQRDAEQLKAEGTLFRTGEDRLRHMLLSFQSTWTWGLGKLACLQAVGGGSGHEDCPCWALAAHVLTSLTVSRCCNIDGTCLVPC